MLIFYYFQLKSIQASRGTNLKKFVFCNTVFIIIVQKNALKQQKNK